MSSLTTIDAVSAFRQSPFAFDQRAATSDERSIVLATLALQQGLSISRHLKLRTMTNVEIARTSIARKECVVNCHHDDVVGIIDGTHINQ
jgi:hypothetical protein